MASGNRDHALTMRAAGQSVVNALGNSAKLTPPPLLPTFSRHASAGKTWRRGEGRWA